MLCSPMLKAKSHVQIWQIYKTTHTKQMTSNSTLLVVLRSSLWWKITAQNKAVINIIHIETVHYNTKKTARHKFIKILSVKSIIK